MLRTNFIVGLMSISILLLLGSCSKESREEISGEKIPISTRSAQALESYQEGLEYVDQFQVSEAAEHFQRAVELDPKFAMAWLQRAYVSPDVNAFLSWIDSASAYAIAVSPAEQLIIRAAEYRVQQKNMQERDVLNQLVRDYSGDEAAHLLLGNYYFGVQQYHLAIKSYTNAISLNDEMITPHNQLGYSQRALGNYGEAEKSFKQYIRMNTENPNAFDSYAELLMEMGRHNESIEFYLKALELDSDFVSSHIGISCNYCFLGESVKARAQLDLLKKMELNPRDIRRVVFSEAISYVYEGQLELALSIIQLNMDRAEVNNNIPNMANDFIALGNLNLELGNTDQAMYSFNQSAKLINESDLQQAMVKTAQITHLFNISRVYAAQEDFTKARQTADKFQTVVRELKNPLQVKLAYQLNGIIALAEKNYIVAIDQFEQSNQLNPLNLYRLGLAYQGNGMDQEAALMIQRASELNVLNSMNQALVLSKTTFSKKVL